jgi:hypothetical protein
MNKAFKAFAKDFAKYLQENNLSTNNLSNKERIEVGPHNLRKASRIFKGGY